MPYGADERASKNGLANNEAASGGTPSDWVPSGEVSSGSAREVIDDARLKQMMAGDRQGFLRRNRFHIVTIALIAVNVLVYVVEVLLSGLSFDIPTMVLVNMGAMYAPLVQAGQVFRFVTPMFLHMDLMHLLFNMVALYSVGEVLERTLGRGNFLLLYFVGCITGNVVSYAADVFAGGQASVSAGASTSVFALFIGVALLGVLHKGNQRMLSEYSRGMLGVIAVNVVYTLLVPGISVSGHLGGAFGGLLGMLMIPAKSLRVSNAVSVVVPVAWVAALAWLLASTGVFA